MQSIFNNIWKLKGPKRPTYKNYYINKYNFLDLNGDYCKIWPKDNINKYSYIFVHCDLNKVVYIKLLLGFNKGKKTKYYA